MADNVTTQSATPATIPASTKIATRDVTYSGDASTQLQIVGLAVVSGSDDAKTVADVTSAAPLPVSAAIAAAQTLATVTTVTTVTDITNQGQLVDNAAFTDGTTRLNMAGFIYDEVAGTALTENDGIAGRVDVKRAQIVVQEDATTRGQRQSINTSGGASVTPIPHTAGGLSVYHLVSAASTNLQVPKNSAGQLYGWYIYNSNAAARKLCFHNASTTPTAGASIYFTLVIPPLSGANVELSHGIPFSTGIAISTVTGLADNDTVAVALNDLVINLFYK